MGQRDSFTLTKMWLEDFSTCVYTVAASPGVALVPTLDSVPCASGREALAT
ncbi:hypothetical protein [Nostoc sp.]|uniref:hypothetical protein n=1 Tax=Nostoc sp. TaxID=1180 RepID=UPI002FF53797